MLTGPRLGATLSQRDGGAWLIPAKPRRAPKARRERVSGADESLLSEEPMPGSRAGGAREAGAIEAAGADCRVGIRPSGNSLLAMTAFLLVR